MEINVLRNFLTIAEEGSMTAAADVLHISQPTLSVQMKHLEKELGVKLFDRHARSVSLTAEGAFLKERATDIVTLADQTEDEFRNRNGLLGGDIRIGCAESWLIAHLAQHMKAFKKRYPLFRFHLVSGDSPVVEDRLDRGLLDFAVIVREPPAGKYESLRIPGVDVWGAVLPSTDPLAAKSNLTADDLAGRDLIASEQAIASDIPRWCGEKMSSLTFAGTCNLPYNGVHCVEAGLGILLTFEHLVDTGHDRPLCFRPLEPRLESPMYFVWRSGRALSPIALRFLDSLQQQ